MALATELAVPVPTLFVALTRKSYDVPFVRPVTVAVVPVAVTVDAPDQSETLACLYATV